MAFMVIPKNGRGPQVTVGVITNLKTNPLQSTTAQNRRFITLLLQHLLFSKRSLIKVETAPFCKHKMKYLFTGNSQGAAQHIPGLAAGWRWRPACELTGRPAR
jgi:hypothetical protein